MSAEINYSEYECPFSHVEKECGHELHAAKTHEPYEVWCSCGFRGPVFVFDPVELKLKKISEKKVNEEFPLYPPLPEEGVKEAVHLLEEFKNKMKTIVDDVVGDVYCDIVPHIESDSWTNFRSQIMNGMCNYGNRTVQGSYDFKRIRKQIFEEYRDEIIKDCNQDLVEENKYLTAENKRLVERLHHHRGEWDND